MGRDTEKILLQNNVTEKKFEFIGVKKNEKCDNETIVACDESCKNASKSECHLVHKSKPDEHKIEAAACRCFYGNNTGSLCLIFVRKSNFYYYNSYR